MSVALKDVARKWLICDRLIIPFISGGDVRSALGIVCQTSSGFEDYRFVEGADVWAPIGLECIAVDVQTPLDDQSIFGKNLQISNVQCVRIETEYTGPDATEQIVSITVASRERKIVMRSTGASYPASMSVFEEPC